MATSIRSAARPHPAAATAARVAVVVLIAALLLITAAQRALAEPPWWVELSRYLPFTVLLLPMIVAVVLSAWLGKGWLAASLAALAWLLVVTMGAVFGAGDEGELPLRLMTYNIKVEGAAERPEGIPALAAEIARHDPDLLVLQDAHIHRAQRAKPGVPADLSFGLPQVQEIGQYVVASRFSLRDCREGSISVFGNDARFLRCIVTAHGRDLDLVDVHFESPRGGLNAARREGLSGLDEWRRNVEARLAEARSLATQIGGSTRPLIVAGDLNAPEASPVVRALLARGLRDAYAGAGHGWGYTYGHKLQGWLTLQRGFSFLRIDHILVSPQIGVADCRVGDGGPSDHRPVVADLLLERH